MMTRVKLPLPIGRSRPGVVDVVNSSATCGVPTTDSTSSMYLALKVISTGSPSMAASTTLAIAATAVLWIAGFG